MLFRPSARFASFLASLLAAGFMLTVSGCSGVTPLGPDAGPPPQHHLRSPIVLQAMRVEQPTLSGGCAAGYTKLSAPGSGPACYRPLGAPETITTAAIAPAPTTSPAGPPNAAPIGYGLMFFLPADGQAELTAVTTRAFDSQSGAVDISVAGKIWGLPVTAQPITQGQFEIQVPTRSDLLQLQHILGSSA